VVQVHFCIGRGLLRKSELQQIFGCECVGENNKMTLGVLQIVQRQCSDFSNSITYAVLITVEISTDPVNKIHLQSRSEPINRNSLKAVTLS